MRLRMAAIMPILPIGLAALRRGAAAKLIWPGAFFRSLTELKDVSPGRRSAAAFWAYRVEMHQGRPVEAIAYLELAARQIDSFYGVVARHALGQKIKVSFDLPPVEDSFVDWLLARPGGQRSFALLQLGETHAAEREMRYLWMEMPENYKLEVMRFAAENGMVIVIPGGRNHSQGHRGQLVRGIISAPSI